MNGALRVMVISLSVLVFTGSIRAGPFEDFFKRVKRTIMQSDEKPHSRRKTHRDNKVAATHEPSSSRAAERERVSGPPDQKNTRTARAAKAVTKSDLRYGTPVPGKQGFVTSPFAPDSGYVDVRGFPPGTEVRDPYSGKVFLTP